MQRIYVGNVGYHHTKESMQSVFEIYGRVANVDLIAGFALVDMVDDADAARAIAELASRSGWFLCALPSPCSAGKAASQ